MFALIAVFLPSVIGVKIIDYLIGKLDLKRTIYWFCILLLLSTVVNNIIAYLVFGLDSQILYYLNTLPILFCKYVIISIMLNIILALGIIVCIKNISIEIKTAKIKEEINVKKIIKGSKRNNKKTISK